MSRLDPYLAFVTRNSHFSLFAAGTFLLLPACLFFLVLAFVAPSPDFYKKLLDPQMLGMGISCVMGILAWCALGLLLLKRSDPLWQIPCWGVGGLFGATAVVSSTAWLFKEPDPLELLLPVLIIGACTLFFSFRNIGRARASLERTRSLKRQISA
jgi:hypothetical protein